MTAALKPLRVEFAQLAQRNVISIAVRIPVGALRQCIRAIARRGRSVRLGDAATLLCGRQRGGGGGVDCRALDLLLPFRLFLALPATQGLTSRNAHTFKHLT